MGLTVGVATISYQNRPVGEAFRFASWLMDNNSSVDWSLEGNGNTLAEYHLGAMLALAEQYSEEKKLSADSNQAVHAWVNSLPHESGYVLLHFSG